jgi:hypothetical protein
MIKNFKRIQRNKKIQRKNKKKSKTSEFLCVTNSKKSDKNVKPSRGILLCQLDVGKNSNLNKIILQEGSFT